MASKVYPCLLWNMEILFASNNRTGQKQCHGTPEAPSERPEGRTWIVWGCLPGEDTDVQTKGPQWTDRWEPGPAVQLSCVSWRLQSPLTMLADTTKPEPGLNCHKARNKLESFCLASEDLSDLLCGNDNQDRLRGDVSRCRISAEQWKLQNN